MKRWISLLALAALLYSSAEVRADSDLYATVIKPVYTNPIPLGGSNVPVVRFALANYSASPLTIDKLGVRLLGSASPASFGNVYFRRTNLAGNEVLEGTTTFSLIDGTAVIQAPALFNIPVDETRDITVYVDVGPGAVAGTTAQFEIDQTLIGYVAALPSIFVEPGSTSVVYTLSAAAPAPAPSVRVLAPNSNTDFVQKGTSYLIRWTSFSCTVRYAVKRVELLKGGVSQGDINLSTNMLACGSMRWSVPTSLAVGSNYRVRVYLTDKSTNTVVGTDVSDAPFNVVN